MALEVITPCAEIPCPQCGGRGKVSDGLARQGAPTRDCVLCKGDEFVTVDRCLDAGWPADVIAEVTVQHKHTIAAAMLIAPEID